jgi:2-polyprenyl-6-methoxyphenol hydroxylase-like FAD-dependent oxidoreductase
VQFHLNGFRPGDPGLHTATNEKSGEIATQPSNRALPETTDVLIVGCGPAGLTLAAQLSAFPDIRTVIVDQKPGPLQLGQADGIACRTMEMFEAFGFVEKVLKESYWVNETCFWKPDDNTSVGSGRRPIVRSGRVQDVEDGLSHMPHVILNQARVHDFYLEVMQRSQAQLVPHYSRQLISLKRDANDASEFPVNASFELPNATHESIRARYVVGCDGARSKVREAIGQTLKGDSANHAWGVMDVLVVSNFPDIRFKALVQSEGEGSLLIIPREGGYLIRVYVEMDKLKENERVKARNISVEQLIAAAQRIFQPYTFDVKEVAWWSVYEIGQRLCDRFDDINPQDGDKRVPRVFIAGDACHTHSPKAGQGMNVSMQDGFNIGWKLASVLRGRCTEDFMHTYSAERQAVAKELIDFDREWANMLSQPIKKTGEIGGAGIDAAEVQNYFVKHGRYTAGTATTYKPALLTGDSTHQYLAKGLVIGTRFHSALVVRIGDGKTMQLGKTLEADGRWRVILFAGQDDLGGLASPVGKLCKYFMESNDSPLKRYATDGEDVDTLIDVRGVFQQNHHQLAVTTMPTLLFPKKGKYGLHDYEKAFCTLPNDNENIYAMRTVDREQGCMVVIRPDQYIAHVLPLHATDELAKFFARFMVQAE